MATPTAIHHLSFLVKDLDVAARRYERAFGLPGGIREELPERGVRTARYRLGETWLVLVQPTREASLPAKHLRECGEGVFLVSLAVDDIESAVDTVQASGARALDARPRAGLEDWRIQDLHPDDFFGVPLQLTEASAGERNDE